MAKPITEMSFEEKCDWTARTAFAGLVDTGTDGLNRAATRVTEALLRNGHNHGIERCAEALEAMAARGETIDPKQLAEKLRGYKS